MNSEQELVILKKWVDEKIHYMLVERNKGNKRIRYMDGPPFPSSSNLHHGHFLVGYIKSTMFFYWAMKGYDVDNIIGLDCHGLPIEMVVNSLLSLKTSLDVETYGIAKYNAKCKETIEKYSNAWAPIYQRMGRWVDFGTAYKTMDTKFMETVWYVFGELFKKGLIYKGKRVLPYSAACGTPLSNFEASQNYKEVSESSLYVSFSLVTNDKYRFVAWTTTPWTLPSNLALAVDPDGEYVRIKDQDKDIYYIIAKSCIKNLFGKKKITVEETILGKDLIGLEYKPLFDSFSDGRTFSVIGASFVQTIPKGGKVMGTGIVHLAPAFGEDDYLVCQKENVIKMDGSNIVCPIDENGFFTNEISMLEGKYFKDADAIVISYLKSLGHIMKKEVYRHSYPYCWRTDTPLMYRVVDSFFVNVSSIRDKLVEANKKVTWVPSYIGEHRFNEWLKEARDWSISRNRYFGTPIPVWMSDDGEEVVCIKSIEELKELAGIDGPITDIHREFIDNIKIPSKMGKGMLTRVTDIFDCWFESGSVPFGQLHYPFENPTAFDDCEFLSDFICEGLDQTRGWFYTLTVLSVALLDKPAFKQVICSGLVLGDDNKKMSKSRGNFTDPSLIIEKYGSDAFRLYQLSSSLVKAEPVSFSEDHLVSCWRPLIPFMNGMKFLLNQLSYLKSHGHSTKPIDMVDIPNNMDEWILTRARDVIFGINESMESAKLYQVYPIFTSFIEDITNWYIKFNRDRLRSRLGTEEWINSLSTLYAVYILSVKAIAPFIPFTAEEMYTKLKCVDWDSYETSVLLCPYPDHLILHNNDLLRKKISQLQDVANTIRSLRSKSNSTTIKIPIKCVDIYNTDEEVLEELKEYVTYLKDEVNVLNVQFKLLTDQVKYRLKPNNKTLGKKYRKQARKIMKAMEDYPSDRLHYTTESVEVFVGDESYLLDLTEFSLEPLLTFDLKETQYASITNQTVIVANCIIDDEVKRDYHTRLFITSIQNIRKNTELKPWDKIKVYYNSENPDLLKTLSDRNEYISFTINYDVVYMIDGYAELDAYSKEIVDIDDIPVSITLVKV